MEPLNQETAALMEERFARDSLIAVATIDGEWPAARTVDAYYRDGAFYVITYQLSGKMRQIAANPKVSIAGEWFCAKGYGENLGHVLLAQNSEMMKLLRAAFAAWYGNGHVNEQDENTCLLKISLLEGVLMDHGVRHEIDFTQPGAAVHQ